MKIDFSLLTQNLELKDGIWYSRENAKISYPEEANARCHQLEENSFWFRHRNRCIIDTVKQFTDGGILYDLGGGNGYVASGLEKAGLKTVLVEPGIQGVLNAQKRGLTNIVGSTFENLQVRENSMDAVGIFDVLEHIEHDEAFLQMIYRNLKPGGLLYITVPAYQFLWSKEDETAGHFRRYTLSSLEKRLNRQHFKSLYRTYLFSFLPIPVFLFRTLPSVVGLNKNPKDMSRHQKAHAPNKGLMNGIFDSMLEWEFGRIHHKKSIPFGGSCFLVAVKS